MITWLSIFCRRGVPIFSAMCLYAGWDKKNFLSASKAALMSFLPSISFWLRFTTPMYPGSEQRRILKKTENLSSNYTSKIMREWMWKQVKPGQTFDSENKNTDWSFQSGGTVGEEKWQEPNRSWLHRNKTNTHLFEVEAICSPGHHGHLCPHPSNPIWWSLQ